MEGDSKEKTYKGIFFLLAITIILLTGNIFLILKKIVTTTMN
jgi:hypothetical protein